MSSIEKRSVAWHTIAGRGSSDTTNDLGARVIAQRWPGKTTVLGQRWRYGPGTRRVHYFCEGQ